MAEDTVAATSHKALPVVKVAALVRLLGSNVEGERTAAVAALGRVLGARGQSFCDLAAVIENAAPQTTANRQSLELVDAAEIIAAIVVRWPDVLSDWELAFLRNLSRRQVPPSRAQRTKLIEILLELQIRGRAA